MAQSVSPTDYVDVETFCFTPLSNKGTNLLNPISVEQYSDDRDFQLEIMASSGKPKVKFENFVDLSVENDDLGGNDDELRVLSFMPVTFSRKRQKMISKTEKGQCSNSKKEPSFVCDICVEPKGENESFKIQGCPHSYCTDCMIKYVAFKLQENVINIRCPVSECNGLLELEYCRSLLPDEVFQRWGNALCEAVILGSQKFYCPFKDCSALMIDDGGQVIEQSVCPNCNRMFCAQCKVPWHAGISCVDFQKLNKDERDKEDIMLRNLAQNKKWARCPNCRFYVEKSMGCMYILCRCGHAFCYNCGAKSESHSHMCLNCNPLLANFYL